ncbi:MAG: two-component regulator propeller domain-containing protein [Pyrinomonadaceae bacterium]
MNFSPERVARRRTRFGRLFAGLTLLCCFNTVRALDPNRGPSDYTRDRWGAEQGFPGATVYAITQTPDGYLWLGTEKGLVRYDGVNFRLYGHADSPLFPTGPIQELLTDAEGNLWIRPQTRSLLRYRDGVLHDVTPELDAGRSGVTAMCRGAGGEALLAVRSEGVFAYAGGRFTKLFSTAERPNWLVIAMAATGDGKVWMGTRDAGILVMSAGQVSEVHGLPDRKVNSLLAAADGKVWVGTDAGVVRLDGDGTSPTAAHAPLDRIQSLALLADRDANVWAGSGRGLFRLNDGGAAALEEDVKDAAAVNAIFEDREGSLWVGSTRGLERLRDNAFMTYAPPDGLPPEGGAVYVDAEGRTWLAPASGGLYWGRGGRFVPVKEGGLDRDVVYSVTGGPGGLWVGRRGGGLTRLGSYDGAAFASETYTRADGLAQNSVYAVALARDGAVWAGTLSGGVTRFKDGAFNTYTNANGLASDSVLAILDGSDGATWFGTASGLSVLSQDRWRTYGSADGLPPGAVNCLAEDSTGALWVGTDGGVALVRAGRVKVPREAPEALREPVLGLTADENGWLWVSTSKHVLRVRRDRLEAGALDASDVREFGLADGLRSAEGVRRFKSVAADALGRVWFYTSRGLSVVSPARVANDSPPAIAHVEAITADGSGVDVRGAVRVPGATRRIMFSFVGLSLNVPGRVRYRYRLDGFDRDWSEPVATREAVYTNLEPGSYRFRVMASNSEGVWNGRESIVEFEIEPAFWQTWWFRLSCLLAAGLTVFAFYRVRMRRLTRLLNVRFEERLAERTRIAQDLHDTLLQGVLSASMQLHVAADQLPDASPAKPLVSRVLQLMTQVIEEGRTAVQGLRSRGGDSTDLAEALSAIRQDFAARQGTDFRINVTGQPRPLHPLVRDGVYRIGREALINAFRHAHARAVEVEIEYGARGLRLTVRDDGTGIDPEVLSAGRSGHWGLSGMRERAEDFGAELEVRSRPGEGTEVRLSIPGDVAFESHAANGGAGRLSKFIPRRWRS